MHISSTMTSMSINGNPHTNILQIGQEKSSHIRHIEHNVLYQPLHHRCATSNTFLISPIIIIIAMKNFHLGLYIYFADLAIYFRADIVIHSRLVSDALTDVSDHNAHTHVRFDWSNSIWTPQIAALDRSVPQQREWRAPIGPILMDDPSHVWAEEFLHIPRESVFRVEWTGSVWSIFVLDWEMFVLNNFFCNVECASIDFRVWK